MQRSGAYKRCGSTPLGREHAIPNDCLACGVYAAANFNSLLKAVGCAAIVQSDGVARYEASALLIDGSRYEQAGARSR